MNKQGSAAWVVWQGQNDAQLSNELEQLVAERKREGLYHSDEVARIQKLSLALTDGSLDVSEETLEKLRRLCQLWDIDLRPFGISSHRKVLGPIIVLAKRIVTPILRLFLKDMIRQQRDFNAAAIALLAELSNPKS